MEAAQIGARPRRQESEHDLDQGEAGAETEQHEGQTAGERAHSRTSTPGGRGKSRWGWGAPLALALAALAIQLPLYRRWISFFDEGNIAQLADELNRGLVLYRDTAYLTFPGIFWATAGLFRLTGPSLLPGRVVMVGLFVLMALVVYALTRQVAGRVPAAAAALAFVLYRPWAFPHWHMLSYSPPAIVLVSVALLVFLAGLGRASRAQLVLAGFLFGLGAVFKQDYGGYTLAGANLFLALRAGPPLRRGGRILALDVAALDVGALVPLAVVVMLIARTGALEDFLIQTIVGPLFVHPFWAPRSAAYASFFGLFPLFGQNPRLHGPQLFSYLPSLLLELHWERLVAHPLFRDTAVVDTLLKAVYLLPYGLALAAAWSLVRRARRGLAAEAERGWERELGLVVVLGALLASFNKPRDWVHLMVLYYPTFVLGALLAARLTRGRWRRGVVGLAALLGATLALSTVWLVQGAVRRYDTPLGLARAPLMVRADEATLLHDLVGYLEQEAPRGAPLVVLPYYPLVNFLAARPGVGRFRTIVPVEPYADRDAQVIASLEAHPETIVLYAYTQVMSVPRMPEFAPELHAYLQARYRLVRSFSASRTGYLFGLLERQADEPPAAVDLLAEVDRAAIEEVRGGTRRRLDGDERARSVARTTWAYTGPVVALRPPREGELVARFSLTPPARSRLVLRAGVNPDLWNSFAPMPITFAVRVRGPAGPGPERTIRLDPSRRLEDRLLVPVEVKLARYAGQPIEIELGVTGEGEARERLDVAGFEAPRVVIAR